MLFRVMMSPIQSLAHFSVIVEPKKTGAVKYDNDTCTIPTCDHTHFTGSGEKKTQVGGQ